MPLNHHNLTAISGYDFVKRVTSRFSDDPVNVLLRCCNNSECDYLELKETIEVTTEQCNKGEVPNDIYWNIAKCIIAMINTRGGVLLIGVSDKDHAIKSIKKTEEAKKYLADHSFQDYIEKRINSKIFPDPPKWKYKKSTYEAYEQIRNYVEPQPLQNEDVLAYFVKPCEKGKFITVRQTHHINKDFSVKGPEILYYRVKGQEGKCSHHDEIKEILKYTEEQREIETTSLSYDLDKSLNTDYGITIEILKKRNNNFVGREKELEELSESLKNGNVPVIHGEGGAGKTELACEFAHLHRNEFRGGCIFLDMANEKSWMSALITLYNNPSESKIIRSIVGNIPEEQENNKAEYICKKLLENLEKTQGRMLFILDNMKSIKELAYKNLSHSKFSKYIGNDTSPRINIIATTRVKDYIPIQQDIIKIHPLGSLDPKSATKLLLKHLPENIAENDNEREAIEKIVGLLGCNAWGIEITGGYLSQNLENIGYPPIASYLKTMKAEGWKYEEGLDTFRKNEITVDKLLAPTVKALEQNTKTNGVGALYLAKCISLFPHAGVTDAPLHKLFEKKFKIKDGTKAALSALENYSLINKNYLESMPESFAYRRRMHHLTLEYFRGTAKNSLKKEISKMLATDPDCPLQYWAELAHENILMAHCPWEKLDTETSRIIIKCNPTEFAKKIDWGILDGYTMAEVLSKHPELQKHIPSYELLYHNDNEKPCCAFASLIAEKPKPFIKHCNFSRLNEKDVRHILKRQPGMVKHCIPAIKNFQKKDWITLLTSIPDFPFNEKNKDIQNNIPWNEFKTYDWVKLIAKKTNYEEKLRDVKPDCKIETLIETSDRPTLVQYAFLIAHNPDIFLDRFKDKLDCIGKKRRLLTLILKSQPQLKCRFLPYLENLTTSQWTELLIAHPDCFVKSFDQWHKLNGTQWAKLLIREPDFSIKCDFSKLNGNDWGDLLLHQPQFARAEAWKSLESTPPEKEFFSPLVRVLYHHPELIEGRSHDFSRLSPAGKRLLLSKAPKLRDKIPSKDLPARDWARLVMANPDFSDDNRFKELNPVELAVILHDQSQLSENIRRQISEQTYKMVSSILKEKTLVLTLQDLLWHLDDARMARNGTKLANVANTLAWAYFILGFKKQAERYEQIAKDTTSSSYDKNYPAPKRKYVVRYIETMADISPGESSVMNATEQANKTISQHKERSIRVLVHKYSQTKNAKEIIEMLKSSAKKNGVDLFFTEVDSKSILKEARTINKDREKNRRIVLLNFLERVASSFQDDKKRGRIKEFHDSACELTERKYSELYDKMCTVSPLYFSKPIAVAGDLLLAEILK